MLCLVRSPLESRTLADNKSEKIGQHSCLTVTGRVRTPGHKESRTHAHTHSSPFLVLSLSVFRTACGQRNVRLISCSSEPKGNGQWSSVIERYLRGTFLCFQTVSVIHSSLLFLSSSLYSHIRRHGEPRLVRTACAVYLDLDTLLFLFTYLLSLVSDGRMGRGEGSEVEEWSIFNNRFIIDEFDYYLKPFTTED